MTEEIQPGGLEIRGGGGQRAAASTRAHMGRGRGMGAKGWMTGQKRAHTHAHTFDRLTWRGWGDVDF